MLLYFGVFFVLLCLTISSSIFCIGSAKEKGWNDLLKRIGCSNSVINLIPFKEYYFVPVCIEILTAGDGG